MYLLDTNIISVVSPTNRERHDMEDLRHWIEAASDRLFLSAITVAEVETGIAKARRLGATRKAEELARWLDLVLHLYSDRILPVDVPTARIAGQLFDQAVGRGGGPDFEDAAIAATAVRSGLVVLTRNVRHFELMDVPLLNPFDGLPSL